MKIHDLESIEKEPGSDNEEKFNRMVKSWLRMLEPRTWSVLYEALKHPTVNMPDIADEVKKSKLGTPAGEYTLVCIDIACIVYRTQ